MVTFFFTYLGASQAPRLQERLVIFNDTTGAFPGEGRVGAVGLEILNYFRVRTRDKDLCFSGLPGIPPGGTLPLPGARGPPCHDNQPIGDPPSGFPSWQDMGPTSPPHHTGRALFKPWQVPTRTMLPPSTGLFTCTRLQPLPLPRRPLTGCLPVFFSRPRPSDVEWWSGWHLPLACCLPGGLY